jgi:5-methylcytosine-specific restriction protein B
VFYEAVRFAAMYAATGDSEVLHALDRQVMQKVLPRLHGSRRHLEATLIAVGEFCYRPGEAESKSFDPLKQDPTEARLPISFDKVRRMTKALRDNQFASFTE